MHWEERYREIVSKIHTYTHTCVCVLSCFSCVQLFVTPWTVAHQAPLSLGFSRQEHWSGLPCPPPGDLPDPGTEPASLMSPALQVRSSPLVPPGKPYTHIPKCKHVYTEMEWAQEWEKEKFNNPYVLLTERARGMLAPSYSLFPHAQGDHLIELELFQDLRIFLLGH